MSSVQVIGMACRLPGAENYHKFWANLLAGKDQIREIPPDRWDTGRFYSADPTKDGTSNSRWAGLIDRVDLFDHRFFGLSSREARSMDPQQRLLLEETWHCLEDAGIPHEELKARVTSVYVSAMTIDYHQNVTSPSVVTDSYACLGNYIGILANRLSNLFGWRGESYALDAACAGSLTALHQARRALLTGECDYAVVAGVSLIVNPWHYVSFSKSRMLSPDGKCRTFDRDANGYVPGEGVSVLLLCREDVARREGHHVHGSILGTATGHVGTSNSITAPSVTAQRRVIEDAAAAAGIGLDTVSYIEAHGTGTQLGDPIEIAALNEAFVPYGPREVPCRIGSVKTSIGHLEAAAGLAGVTKVLLMMRHRTIVRTLNLVNVNPLIDFEAGLLKPAIESEPWSGDILRAGVSGFGFGGTNAHVILEAAAAAVPMEALPSITLPFMLSTRSATSFRELWLDWRRFTTSAAFAEFSLPDIICTLATGRASLNYRWAAAVTDKAELQHLFDQAPPEPSYSLAAPRIMLQSRTGTGVSPDVIAKLQHLNVRPIAIVEAETRTETVTANRTAIARYDPATRRMRLPWALDETYLAALRDELVLPGVTEFQRLIQRSRDLAVSNFTFRSYLGDWRRFLGSRGDPLAWIETPPTDPKLRLLLVLCLATVNLRLSERWHLPKGHEALGAVWMELSRLIAAGLLGEGEAVALVEATGDDIARLAPLVVARALIAEAPPVGPLLLAHSADRPGIVEMDAALTDLTVTVPDGSITPLLQDLWQAGAPVNWAAFNLSHRIVELPLYPFDGHRHWIDLEDSPAHEISASGPEQTTVSPGSAPLDDYAALRLFIALDRIGCMTPLGIGMSREEAMRRCKALPKHQPLLEAAIVLLAQHGLVELRGVQCRALIDSREAAVRADVVRHAATAQGDEFATIADLIERGTGAFTAVLGGRAALGPNLPYTDANTIERYRSLSEAVALALVLFSHEHRNDLMPSEAASLPPAPSEPTLMDLIRRAVAESIEADPATIGDDARFVDIGVDSLAAGDVAHLLTEALGYPISLHVIDDHPTVSRLAYYLAGQTQAKVPSRPATGQSLLNLVRAIVGQVTESDPAAIADDARLADIGVDSLAAGDVAQLLGEALGYDISLHVIDDYPTVAKLACYLGETAPSEKPPALVPDITIVADIPKTQVWQVAQAGNLDSLAPLDASRRLPAAKEVEVEVIAAGLNFRDVMEGLGRLGDQQRPLGLEFSGRITALGSGVSGFSLGDAVVGVAIGCLTRHVVTQAILVTPKPPGLSFAEAACAPIVFLTATWILESIARLGRGQTVLVHAASGGVGLAAVQIVRLAGATVLGTAGNAEKRAHLHALGIDCVGDSRSLSFAEVIRGASGEAGVDVIVNCLAGAMTDASLGLVRPGGIFIELGKTDIRAEDEITARYPGIRYTVFDLLAEIDRNPERVGQHLAALMRRFTAGELKALPLRGFAFADAVAALRLLARAKHIGKVVITDEPVAPAISYATAQEGIAITGMAGRFPGAPDLNALWRLLRDGGDAIGLVPDGRWDEREFAVIGHGEPRHRAGGFLADAEIFDAAFFGISPREAMLMDPQQRLLLEQAWLALTDAGISTKVDAGLRIGVYVGASASDYSQKAATFGVPPDRPSLLAHMPSSLSARVNYVFDLKGPSLTVDMGCVSAVAALKLAADALRRGEVDVALAGAVAVQSTPQLALMADQAELLAPDGRCRAFAADAQGLGLSEGVGVVVLKRLSDAMTGGDTVYAIIRAVAVNQNGATNGMSAPSVAAQTALAHGAFTAAGITPEAVSYIEAHGVGTRAGDAAEVTALTEIFGRGRALPFGSVKSNIGHTLAVAGMAGLFKVVLQLRHGMIAPSLHAAAGMVPELAGTKLALSERLAPWPLAGDRPRLAAINAFAINGANGFMLVEQGPAPVPRASVVSDGMLLLFAAGSQAALKLRMAELAVWLRDNPVVLADLALSVNAMIAYAPTGTQAWRAAFVVNDISDLLDQLEKPSITQIQRREAETRQAFAAMATQFCAEAAAADGAARHTKLRMAAQLFVDGVDVIVPPHPGARRIGLLPGYRFERQRFWMGEMASEMPRSVASSPAPVKEDSRLTALRETAAAVLRLPVSALSADSILPRLGLDSLLALDLRGRLTRALGTAPDPAALLSGRSLEAIAADLPVGVAQAPVPMLCDPVAQFAPFPLTDVQLAYWLGRRGDFALGGACHVYWEFTAEADRDPDRLESALNRLIALHEMLRAVVGADGSQRVLPTVPHYAIARYDWRGDHDVDARLENLRAEMAQEIFEPAHWPLFRIAFSQDAAGSRLHLSIDLLIIDVPSLAVLLDQWSRLYRDPAATLVAPGISFRDYVLHQKRQESGPAYLAARAYWTDHLPSLPPAPRLAGMKPLDVRSDWQWNRHRSVLAADRWQALQAQARTAGSTPVATLVTALAEVLARWAEARRFTLNLTVNDREPLHPDIGGVVGDFTSTVLLGLDLTPPQAFAERARMTGQEVARHLGHARFAGIKVLQQRGGSGEAALMPVVFTSMLGFGALSGPLGRLDFGATQTPQVWLDVQVMEDDGALVVTWDAIDALFPDGLMSGLFAAWVAALHGLATKAELWQRPLGPWLDAAERERRSRHNATGYPVVEGLLHEPFLRQALLEPGRVAVVTSEGSVTYGALLGQAMAIAEALGPVEADTLVAVALPKGCMQITAVIGVLIAGGAYLPIDPSLPAARQHQLRDRGAANSVLTLGDLATVWPDDVRVIAVDRLAPAALRDAMPPRRATPGDLAYVIFTSGSTGEPKGVMIEHRAALNTVLDVNDRFGVGPEDRVLGLSALSFDLSVYDIFGVLGAGGAVVLPDSRSANDPAHLAAMVACHGVTLWNSVPMFVQLFLEGEAATGALPLLRLVMMSGDWIPLDLPARLRKANPALEIVSLGGATEASIWSIAYPIGEAAPGWSSVPYGYPMRNQRFHVLDDRMDHCPDWVAGGLYIAGTGLARGYWRDEATTAARFIHHPVTGERLYQTGDLGRYRDDGVIEFLGREDGQVKVGGYRIELGEIEIALIRHPAVSQAAVVLRDDVDGRKSLSAFYVTEGGTPSDGVALRRHLAAMLPSYMVPATFHWLEAMPLNANDKVDRKALATVLRGAAETRIMPLPPVHEAEILEVRILAIWREVLVNPLLPADGKLFENGAHSFHAVDASTRINRALNIGCTVTDIFEFATVRSLARALAARQVNSAMTVPDVPAAPALATMTRSERRRQFRALTSD